MIRTSLPTLESCLLDQWLMHFQIPSFKKPKTDFLFLPMIKGSPRYFPEPMMVKTSREDMIVCLMCCWVFVLIEEDLWFLLVDHLVKCFPVNFKNVGESSRFFFLLPYKKENSHQQIKSVKGTESLYTSWYHEYLFLFQFFWEERKNPLCTEWKGRVIVGLPI